ncbi:methyltransferase family protein [Anseongella ginsenosidimutans]|uniref:Methyltransferase family protein n=1 Tax=Anseongella ginsenosidimutans TaxID=496056 RepID=A0A4R3KWL1_9SPHI|nr:class I SAM-dependent methyltransferase [Anseongella ginsenosidimutans]QEC51303.1 SAM-dependent methyltransferase [Anseongella ginsenosidimutans]TCS90005.1 methyltransferase family protein [Anseongella ginsenosidimutans]
MLNTYLLKGWLRHFITAKTRHGLHSPFMYRLADEVIYDKNRYPAYDLIEKERRRLLADDRIINLTDLGAGSRYGNRKQKKVSDLAATALKPRRLAQLIYRLARDLRRSYPGDHAAAGDRRPATILELGTCLGITTAYLASAFPHARVITIEGCEETAAIAREGFERLSAVTTEKFAIESLTGNFDEVLPQLLGTLPSLDLLFIDGNHRKAATLNYFEWCLPALHENSLVIFDDIHWSKGMEEAWELIREHPAVSLTADLFHIGLVFFRKGQAKEHFNIRI